MTSKERLSTGIVLKVKKIRAGGEKILGLWGKER